MDRKYRNREIRWLFLHELRAARLAGKTQSGGWLNHLMMRKLLSLQGYDLSDEELRDCAIYLQDNTIGCAEDKKIGEKAPYIYKYRITARGVQVLEGEIKVRGIGIYAGGNSE